MRDGSAGTKFTEEDRARIAELVDAGLSARAVGEAIGRTKSSIIGYCHRNGLKLAGADPAVAAAQAAERRKTHPPKVRRPARKAGFVLFARDSDTERLPPQAKVLIAAPLAREPVEINPALLSATATCAWYDADPRDGCLPCGRQAMIGGAYCPGHMVRAYVVPPRPFRAIWADIQTAVHGC